MEKKQTVVASDALTKDQIRELAVNPLQVLKTPMPPILISTYQPYFFAAMVLSIQEIT